MRRPCWVLRWPSWMLWSLTWHTLHGGSTRCSHHPVRRRRGTSPPTLLGIVLLIVTTVTAHGLLRHGVGSLHVRAAGPGPVTGLPHGHAHPHGRVVRVVGVARLAVGGHLVGGRGATRGRRPALLSSPHLVPAVHHLGGRAHGWHGLLRRGRVPSRGRSGAVARSARWPRRRTAGRRRRWRRGVGRLPRRSAGRPHCRRHRARGRGPGGRRRRPQVRRGVILSRGICLEKKTDKNPIMI